jgi:hypothetical protein
MIGVSLLRVFRSNVRFLTYPLAAFSILSLFAVAVIGKGKNRCYPIPSREMVALPMENSQRRESATISS